ncbi:MAG: hypothetical protein NTV44_00115, partial [Firmicutes bacterium]|nr:hypothetical protein [Bacillota bacterium]
MESTDLKKAKPHGKSLSKKTKKVMTYVFLILFAIVALLPFYYLIITAMKDLNEASTQSTMWPHSFALWDNIKFVITYRDYNVVQMFANTMFIFIL